MSSSMDREASRIAAIAPLSREGSDVTATPAVRKTDVRTETQPNGSEVTTTIVEFTDQVFSAHPSGRRGGGGAEVTSEAASLSGSRDHGSE